MRGDIQVKVVETGYKLDLHIHSIYSKGKDHAKVNYNTLDNIGTLAEKLNEQNVQLCALTDHDAFNFNMYKALKEYESKDHSVLKVFPGVEFSVEFEGDTENVVVHVIAIFDDSDEAKIQKIENILQGTDGKPVYDRHLAFSEEKFLSILRDISLDTILIAHQKGSLTSKIAKKSDANTVGEEKFQEFLYTDFFEAYEFKNKKNEIFNKNYIFSNGVENELRFVTGSDCHDWRFYPQEDEKDTSEFSYTYVKCLPTFRGLVMAVTDYRRIKTVNSFFNPTEFFLPEIKMMISGLEKTIPLSRGLNVIIGDNSIGKSLLLHKLTNYTKKKDRLLKGKVITGYDNYLKENGVTVVSQIEDNQIFCFDMQGEVRDKFEQEKINSDDFLKRFYPAPISSDAYKEIVQRELNKIYSYLSEKFILDDLEENLGLFPLLSSDIETAESLTFVGNVSKNNKKFEGLSKVSADIITITEKIKSVQEDNWLDAEDKEKLEKVKGELLEISDKYEKKANGVDTENTKIGLFQTVISGFKQRYQTSISDAQKQLSAYTESLDRAVDKIVEIRVRRQQNVKPDISIDKVSIDIQTNQVFEYQFNSRLNILSFDTEYVMDLFTRNFKVGVRKSVFDMTRQELCDSIPHYEGAASGALDEIKRRIQSTVDDDFSCKFTITQQGMDRTKELSSGFNAKIYFDLLSYENDNKGIYIIDQPEDNISQKAIHEYLLKRFKVMGERRQVLIVTHNPQFIVNLDVDNVIFLGKNEKGILVQSGALEYKDDEYSMLDIISTHIEGGLDTLKRRWKRYEKNSKVSDI